MGSNMTQIKTAFICLSLLAGFVSLLNVAAQPYKCIPYEPKAECELSRYEVHLHDMTGRGKKTIGMAEGYCIYAIGKGKSKRYIMEEAHFHTANRTDYFDRVEFPAEQSLVCEVK